jgi:hypothetical protein
MSGHASSLRHWCNVFRPVGDISSICCRKNCNVVRGTLLHSNVWDILFIYKHFGSLLKRTLKIETEVFFDKLSFVSRLEQLVARENVVMLK